VILLSGGWYADIRELSSVAIGPVRIFLIHRGPVLTLGSGVVRLRRPITFSRVGHRTQSASPLGSSQCHVEHHSFWISTSAFDLIKGFYDWGDRTLQECNLSTQFVRRFAGNASPDLAVRDRVFSLALLLQTRSKAKNSWFIFDEVADIFS